METKINNIAAASRPILQKYGEYYGKQIYRVTATNPDLMYSTNKANGKQGLRIPVTVFVIEPIDIFAIEVDQPYAGSEPKIVINRTDAEAGLSFPLAMPEFKSASPANVKAALDAAIKNLGNPVFFDTDEFNKLNELITKYNRESKESLQAEMQNILGMVSAIDSYNQRNEIVREKYLRECGVKAEVTIEATITTTEE